MNVKAKAVAALRKSNLGVWADFPQPERVKVTRLADGRRLFEMDTQGMEPNEIMALCRVFRRNRQVSCAFCSGL